MLPIRTGPARATLLFLLLLLLDGGAPLCQAGQHWICLSNGHFVIYTTNDQAAASKQLRYLETVRSFFAAAKPFGGADQQQDTKVIAFSSSEEYAAYSFRSEGSGYFERTYKTNYIVLGRGGSDEQSLMGHEFTHLVVTNAGLKLPIWLNEGVADVYSTVEIDAHQARIGRPPAGFWETVRRRPFLSWDVIFAVDGSSSIYQGGENLNMLYAQSWALTHMLALDQAYSGGFRQFLEAVAAGQKSNEALRSVYQKGMPEIGADLAAYIRRKTLPVVQLQFTPVDFTLAELSPGTSASPPVLDQPAEFDVQFALANVLAWKESSYGEGRQRLTALATSYPERPEPEETLGILALEHNQRAEARRSLALAVQRHSNDPEVLFESAVLEKEAGTGYAAVRALLQRAIDVRPGMDKARLELGFLDFEDFNYQQALAALTPIQVIPPESRFQTYFAMGQCYANLENLAQAELYLSKAVQAAQSAAEKQQASDLVDSVRQDRFADTPPSPGAPAAQSAEDTSRVTNVRGVARRLQCNGAGKTLSIESEGHELLFDIADPHLVVRHPSEDYANWRCGPLKPVALTVVYRTPSDDTHRTQSMDGKAMELLF